MITKKQLKHGLEWISGKTKITVKKEGYSFFIYLYPNYPSDYSINLYMDIVCDQQVKVIDLVGNGYNSNYHKSGFGKQMFNIGIQALYAYYGLEQGDSLTKEIRVYGETAPLSDNGDEKVRIKDRDNRNKFWLDFGFELDDLETFRSTMQAPLSELKLLDGIETKNGSPRLINLEEFWPFCEAPQLLDPDIKALMNVDIEQFNLEQCPTSNDAELAYSIFAKWSLRVKRVLFYLFSSLSIYLSYKSIDNFNDIWNIGNAIVMVFVGIFFSHVISMLVASNGYIFLPYYNRYDKLITKRGEIISGIRKYIEDTEQLHNGLFWRIYPGIIALDSNLSDKVFDEMAEASKDQDNLMLSGRYKEYKHFIESSKSIIAKNKKADIMVGRINLISRG